MKATILDTHGTTTNEYESGALKPMQEGLKTESWQMISSAFRSQCCKIL